jgi:hypothetical protein
VQDQPVRVTTFLLKHPGVDDQLLVPVMRALDDGLKRNTKLEMKDLDTRLAEFAQEVPQDQIDQARAQLADGLKALNGLEINTAVKKLSAAIDGLGRVLPFIKKQELADAMMSLAIAQFELGDRKGSRQTLSRLLCWRSDYKYDVAKHPPTLIGPFEEAKKELDKAKRGSLEVRSTPSSAQAYVDGRYVGVTPTTAEGLPIGDHYVTLKKEGYRKAVMTASVSAKAQQVVSIPLERSGKYLLVEQALAAMEKSLGNEMLDPSADNLKEVLFVDHAVFVRASPGAAGMIDLDLYLYDLRNRRRLSRVTKAIPVEQVEAPVSQLTSALYLNVNYEAELEAPKDAPIPKQQERKPFWKTWWFWTACGVGAVGIIVAGVAIAETQPKTCGGGNFCPGFQF